MTARRSLIAVVLTASAAAALAQDAPRNEASVAFAAGSLRAALTDLAGAFEAQSSQALRFSFGASGLLNERIESGERAASSSSPRPTRPMRSGRGCSPP